MVPIHPAVIRRAIGALAGLVAGLLPLVASAQDTPGRFDFYVLALSWSPGYCAFASRPDPAQCSGVEPPGFTIHGLWPQFERGYPEYCGGDAVPRLPRSTTSGIADIMPSAGLAQHEWEKHGACSGLRPEGYFSLMRRASERIVIPKDLVAPREDETTSAPAVEAEFIAANPGLPDRGIAVACDRDGVVEVRICLTRQLGFRRCPEVDQQSCRRPSISLPAAD